MSSQSLNMRIKNNNVQGLSVLTDCRLFSLRGCRGLSFKDTKAFMGQKILIYETMRPEESIDTNHTVISCREDG